MPRLSGPSLQPGEKGPSGFRVFIVLMCVSVVLVTLYSREGSTGPVHIARSAVQTVATPFEWAGSQIARPFRALGNAMHNLTASSATLSDLEAENAELTSLLASMEEYRLESERLEQLLGLTGAYGASGIGARVVGGSGDSWSSSIVIDAGASDGVEVDMAVVCGSGAVGQVTSTAATSSTVRLLMDSASGVSAMLQGSRETGVLSGSLDGSMHLDFVPTTATVSVGELVVTSGMGGVYPKGLLVGTVTSVSSTPSSLYYDITVAPAAEQGSYEEVYVITSFDASLSEEAAESVLATGELPVSAAADEGGAAQGSGADGASDGQAEGEVTD